MRSNNSKLIRTAVFCAAAALLGITLGEAQSNQPSDKRPPQNRQTSDLPAARRPASNQGFKEVPSTLATPKLPVPTVEELVKKDPKAAVEAVAEVLGMVRGPRRDTRAVNTIEYVGTGTMSEPIKGKPWRDYRLTQFKMGLDFVIPAARVQIQSVESNAKRQQIQVVAAKQAWNEEKPGINGTAVPGMAEDRLRQIWLSPHGAMWAALRASEEAGNARVANEAGRLAITFSWDGAPTKMLLNGDLLPERVQIRPTHSDVYGDEMLQATYSEYKDFQGYLLECPRRMTYAAGDHTLLDLNVSECIVNPYVIFPTPVNMKASQ